MFERLKSAIFRASLVTAVPDDAHLPVGVAATVSVTPAKPTPTPAIATKPTQTAVSAPVAAVQATTAGTGPDIIVINSSTVLTNAQVEAGVAAAQIQIDRDFEPAWGIRANVKFETSTASIPATAWVVHILDTSDQDGALGYHDMSGNDMPIGKIFAKDDQKYNLSWSVTLSHELLEMLGDPYLNNTVFIQATDTTGNLIAFEMCDPVEDDSLGYKIDGILMSDFVLPAYFETGHHPDNTKFDFCGHLTGPLTIAAGGYLSVFPVNPTTSGWTQRAGAEGLGPRAQSKGPYSRAKRRGHITMGRWVSNLLGLPAI